MALNVKYNAALNAYNRASKSFNKLASGQLEKSDSLSAKQRNNILRVGDSIEVARNKQSPSFSQIVNSVAQPVRKAEQNISALSSKGSTNIIELTEAIASSEIAISSIVSVRDKFVEAAKQIFGTQL